MPRRKPKCKKCGELIDFVLKAGFIPKGAPRYFVVNADDRRPHRVRCELTQALREAKLAGPAQLKRLKQQGGLAKREALTPTIGEQLDAFETA